MQSNVTEKQKAEFSLFDFEILGPFHCTDTWEFLVPNLTVRL